MKKIFLVVLVFFISLFIFNINVKASENVNISCTYENPMGGKDITLVFTNYEVASKDSASLNGATVSSYYTANGSSFSEIWATKVVSQNGVSAYSYRASNVMTFDGYRYLIEVMNSETPLLVKDSNNNSTGEYSCPTLKYTKYGDNSNPLIILGFAGYGYCSNHSCETLVSKTNTIVNPDVPDNKEVSSCSFSIKLPKTSTNRNLNFTLYSDGSLYANFLNYQNESVDYKINFSVADTGYSLMLPYNVSDLNNPSYLMSQKSALNNLVSVGNNGKLTCATTAYVYAQGSNYIITDKYENIPDAFKGSYNEVNLEDSSNANTSEDPIGGNRTDVDTYVNSSCSAYLGVAGQGDNIASFLDNIWGIIKVGSILLVIVFGMLDFSKVVTNDKEKVPEVVRKVALRLVFLIIILMLPTLIEVIGNLAGVKNILCGIK